MASGNPLEGSGMRNLINAYEALEGMPVEEEKKAIIPAQKKNITNQSKLQPAAKQPVNKPTQQASKQQPQKTQKPQIMPNFTQEQQQLITKIKAEGQKKQKQLQKKVSNNIQNINIFSYTLQKPGILYFYWENNTTTNKLIESIEFNGSVTVEGGGNKIQVNLGPGQKSLNQVKFTGKIGFNTATQIS